MQKTLRRLSHWLGFIVLGCYVLLGAAFLGARYWVLPNIDKWRVPLQRELSLVLPVQVELGGIEAEWRGRNPRISVRNAILRDDSGRELLRIPTLEAIVAWHSLFSGTPHFLTLQADGVALSLRRDRHDRISLVGYELESSNGRAEQNDSALLHWLAGQGDVRLTNARIAWHDERRGAPPLELHDVALSFSAGERTHEFAIHARPPVSLGSAFLLQGRVHTTGVQTASLSLQDISGLFHVSVEDMWPAAWAPWMDVHSVLEEGRVSWQGWQQFSNGRPARHVSQITVDGALWRPDTKTGVRADSARVYVAGDWAALQEILPEAEISPAAIQAGQPADIRVALQMQGLNVQVDGVFEQPLHFDEVALAVGVRRDPVAGLQLAVDQAQVRNVDMDLAFQGSWHQHGAGAAGVIDLDGRFERAELSAIVRYLPAIVDDDARQWLRYGLLAGRLVHAPLKLQGDLEQFPFGDQPESGNFIVGGPVQGAVIDYAPASAVGQPGWPRLENLEGHAQLHRVDLTIQADSMQMRPGGQTIDLRDVNARISNIERDSVLTVEGIGRAPAASYLALLRESPLNRLLDNVFEGANGEGEWEVPISLTIPLLDTASTQVQGDVVFDKGGLHLAGGVPALSGLQGRITFTEELLQADGLKGRVLGGPVSISGGLGKEQKGLNFAGTFSAEALNKHLGGQLSEILTGTAPYRLDLQRNTAGAYGMQLESSLEGLAIHLPAPLSKQASSKQPLRVEWSPSVGERPATLNVSMGELVASFLHRPAASQKAGFFYAGAVGLGNKAEPPADGLAMDIKVPEIDFDAWRQRATAGGKNNSDTVTAIFPKLRDLRLQVEKAHLLGTDLDRLTFTARRPEGNRWRVDISSTETAGTLFWQERQGRVEGEIEAHFERLALGASSDKSNEKSQDDDTAFDFDDEIDIPAIRLKVDRLRLYGRDLGALSVVGLNESQGRIWRLQQLELSNQYGSLHGAGVWRLQGPQRGLTIDARAMFDDLGAYLEQAGFTDLMEGGHGQIQGVVEWRQVPWQFERSGLQGDLNVDLAKGRFVNVGSRSARLLELLSLQSVQRLASLNWNPAGLLKQGFPFDTLQGHIKLENGILHSENYRVAGPVAAIFIAGDVDLPRETLDLYAAVVPNLDVSGAAIAAGIAVNPVVGVGAFITQWLLKDPMSRAMTVEYRVKGDFDSPDIAVIDTGEQKSR